MSRIANLAWLMLFYLGLCPKPRDFSLFGPWNRTKFDYDDLNRLWNADYGMGGGYEQFNYDLLGNRNSVVDTRPDGGTCNYTHNVANEYLTVCGTAVTHDTAGNLTADHRGYVYEYDMENRLTKVSRSDSTVVATFEYDALGRRIEKVDAIAGTTRRYYYDDQRVAVETAVGGAAENDVRHFVFGNFIDEVLMMHVIPAQAGTPDLYCAHDHLYSPVALFAANGAVAERYEYDVYGFCRILDSNFDIRASSLYGNPYAFTGRQLDTLDAGSCTLYHYRHRDYSPQLGRFMQHDPLGVNPNNSYSSYSQNVYYPPVQYTDGVNIYEYAKSSPEQNKDPYGLVTIKECYDIWEDRMDRIRRNLGSCTVNCLGIVGETEAKCAIGCAVFKSLGWWQFKTCMATCTGGNTLIGLWCESWCFKGFKNESYSANEALEKCKEKACGKII